MGWRGRLPWGHEDRMGVRLGLRYGIRAGSRIPYLMHLRFRVSGESCAGCSIFVVPVIPACFSLSCPSLVAHYHCERTSIIAFYLCGRTQLLPFCEFVRFSMSNICFWILTIGILCIPLSRHARFVPRYLTLLTSVRVQIYAVDLNDDTSLL